MGGEFDARAGACDDGAMKRLLIAIALVVCGCGGNEPSGPDLSDMTPGMTDGGGTKMFGDQCMVPGTPGDCAPGLICDMFVMGTIYRCTRLCDQNPNPTNCPAPSAGTCNGKNECKFTM